MSKKQNPNADLKYDKLMRVKSIRTNNHFKTPKVLNIDSFTFPIDSVVHWFKVSQTIDNPSNKVGYLKNNRCLIETVLSYPNEGTIGSFTYLSTPSPASIIKDASKAVKEFRWLNPQEIMKITPKVCLVYNYGSLLSKYRYSEQILRRYNMYYNSAVTMMDRLLLSRRNIFLVLDIPSKLPTRKDLDKMANKLTNSLLNNLPTTAHFNLLELWKFLSPTYNSKSVFNTLVPYVPDKRDEIALPGRPSTLTRQYWDKVNLILVVDTKCVLVNLATLMSYIEEWNIESKAITPMKYRQFAFKFLDMLQYVVENAALTEEELESHANAEEKVEAASGIDGVVKAANVKDPKQDLSSVKVPDLGLDDDDEIKGMMDYEDQIGDMMLPDTDEYDNTDTSEEYKDHDIDTEALTGIELGEDLVLDKDFKSLDELIKQEFKYDIVLDKIENMKANRSISKQKYDRLKKTIEEQPNKACPYKDMKDKKLKDVLDDNQDDYTSGKADSAITDNVAVFDKTYNKNTVASLNKDYIKNQYKKDIVRTAYSLQNSNVVINDYEINEIDSILGTIEEHTLKIDALDGSQSTIKINLPKIEENGDVRISSNTYKIRMQKTDKPIRKVDFNTVMLSSYYGKVSVVKAKTNYNNVGYWLMNTVVMLTNTIEIKNLVLLPMKNPDVKLPIDYTHFSRFIKSFTFKDMNFLFDHTHRGSLFKNMPEEKIKEIEDGVVIVGAKGNTPIVMDFENRLFLVTNGSYKEIPNMYDMLGIDPSTSPIEYITVKVIKKDIPAVVILAYYVGLEELLRLLKVKYSKHDKKVRDIHKYNQYLVEFKDTYLLISRDHGQADLILSGLLSIEKTLKEIPLQVMNDKSAYSIVFNKLNIPILYFNEIKIMETMFVDPMTLTLLKQLKEPTNFKGLILKAAELLVDDSYVSSNNIDGVVIKGYERVAGLMYRELVTALKDHENRTFFSKSKVTVNPFSVMNKITEDSTTVLADDLNPIASIKQQEDVSMLGAFGRSKESMSKDTRVMHDSEVGVLSEATKDSGDVGITSYLTADPNIANTRGVIEKQREEAWSNLLSTNSLIAPFALTDDVKRLRIIGSL